MLQQNKPIKPPIRFLTGDFELIEANIDNPNIANAKYSGGPNLYAILASVGAKIIRTVKEIIPPTTLDTAAMPKALPAWPFWAIGKPSKAVAAAGGAPGALINIAVIDPPNVPPQYNAAIAAIAWLGSKYIVNGNNNAMAIPELNPGRAPINTPTIVDPSIKPNVVGFKIKEIFDKISINKNS